MTVLGSSNTGVTLTPSEHNVTLTGNISGNGAVVPVVFTFASGGTFVLDFLTSVDAPGPTAFDITNDANIDLARTGNPYQAMLLGAPGIVINNATIIGGAGIDMRGTSGGGYIRNNGFIGVTPGGYDGPGINIEGSGGVSNAGTILGGNGGVYISKGGQLDNSGQISARHAVYGAGLTLTNTGRIIGFGSGADGASLSGLINNFAAGTIAATPTVTGNTGTAIKLFGASTIDNSGLILGAYGVYSDFIATATTIQNNASGTIAGALADAIDIRQPGSITNAGLILAAHTAIKLENSGLITNIGTIEVESLPNATTTPGAAISINSGGTIIDSGLIAAPGTAIAFAPGFANLLSLAPGAQLTGAVILNGKLDLAAGPSTGTLDAAYLFNAGAAYIAANAAWQIAGTLFANAVYNYGTIKSPTGIALATTAQVNNYGTITSGGTAIVSSAGYIYNSGLIAGANGIVLATGTVTNLGTITASHDAIDFTSTSAKNLVILAPSSVIQGKIQLAGGALDLLAGPTAGTLAAKITDAAVTIAPRANWDFTSALTLKSLTNNGTLTSTKALAISGPVTGTGTLAFAKSLTLAGPVATQQHIDISGTDATLTLKSPSSFAASIKNFALSDTIDLATVPLASITGAFLAKNILTLTESTGTITLNFSSIPAHDTFALFADATGTGITLASPTIASGFLAITQPPKIFGIPTITLQP